RDGLFAAEAGDLVQLLHLLLDEGLDLLGAFLDLGAAFGELALVVLERAFLLELGLVFLFEGVFTFFEPAFLFAKLVAGLLRLAVELLALAIEFLLRLQLGFLEKVLRLFAGGFQKARCLLAGAVQTGAVEQAGDAVANHQPHNKGQAAADHAHERIHTANSFHRSHEGPGHAGSRRGQGSPYSAREREKTGRRWGNANGTDDPLGVRSPSSAARGGEPRVSRGLRGGFTRHGLRTTDRGL